MDHRLIEGLMEAIAPLIKTYVDERIAKEVAPLHARLKGFEDFQPLYIDFSKKLGDIPDKTVSEQIKDLRDVVDALNERPIRDGEDGKDADPEVVKEMVLKAIDVKSIGDQVLASIPVPQNGKDAEPVDPAEVAKFLVDLMPVAKDGKDVDMVEVERLVLAITDQKFALREAIHDETVRPIVEEVVAAHVAKIAPAEPGRDGKDADIEVVRAIIVEEVAKVAPADGKDADPEVIRSMVVEEVAKVEIPAGKDGQSVTVDDVRPLIEEMVAALPPAAPGKDADPVEIAALIVGDVAKLIPVPADGKSVTIEEVLPHLEKMVEGAVAAVPLLRDVDTEMLPDGKTVLFKFKRSDDTDEIHELAFNVRDGADGKSITVDDVVPVLQGMVDALPKAADGKDADPVEVAALIIEDVAKLIPVPAAGKDGVDMVDLLIDRSGSLIATFSNGTTKTLGNVVGKNAELTEVERLISDRVTAIPVPEMDRAAVEKFVAEELNRISLKSADEFAPDEVASNIAVVVKMMAEMPQTKQQTEMQPINVYSDVRLPEMKFPETVVHLTVPEQAAPVVNMAAPVVNVSPANVEFPKRGKEVTTVTSWDKDGRIKTFEKQEVEDR